MAGAVKKGRKRRRTAKNRVVGRKDGLTLKQKKFVEFYIQLGNATEAAKSAGYSDKTAYRTGADNLKKPQIQKAIQKIMDEEDEKRVVQAKEALQILSSIARGEIEEEEIAVIGKAGGGSQVEHVNVRTRINNRIKALTLLAKYHGLLEKKEKNETEYQGDGLMDALNRKAKDVWDK